MRRLYEEHEALNRADFCGKCSSDRIVTAQRGFNAQAMVLWFVVAIVTAIICVAGVPVLGVVMAIVVLPVGFIGGIAAGAIGKGKVINMCANCGNKWEPGK